jgi:undecaprenyl phosphate-alpha-L-ara4FN deformylase
MMTNPDIQVGLRIDVDTFRGTKLGVPSLCQTLARHDIKASFFFSVGPDNMGRHLWRLLRPAFLWKMMRTRAASLYGWDIIFKGTFWPGPVIGRHLGPQIRMASNAGHEIGLHAWDHHAWQAHIETMTDEDFRLALRKGFDILTEITGSAPTCSAVPGWKCTDEVLTIKEQFPFRYNSDCRGHSIFMPVVDGQKLLIPQVPVTLPTYDEAFGKNGITNENYNAYIVSLIQPGSLNVLTIHAEAEGIACSQMFDDFLRRALAKSISFVPLGKLLEQRTTSACATITRATLPGREGWLAFQTEGET